MTIKRGPGRPILFFMAMILFFTGCQAKKLKSSITADETPDYEVTFAYPGNMQTDLDSVQTEMNKILRKKINATIKLMPISDGYSQHIKWMLAKNEKLDLFFNKSGMNSDVFVQKGLLQPLAGLLNQYGPDIKSVMGEDILDHFKVNGNLYTIPSMRDLASSYGLLMRKDLVEKYHIDLSTIKDAADLGKVFQQVKENEPNLNMVTPFLGFNSIVDGISSGHYDFLNDGIGVLPLDSNTLKLVNYYDTREYEQFLQLARDWYLKGYMDREASLNTDNGAELVRANKVFSYFARLKPGVEEQESRFAGIPLVSVTLAPPVIMTSDLNIAAVSIAQHSQRPDLVMQMLNLLYKDQDLLNLLYNGIEGKHYVKTEEGTIQYPEGVTISNVGWRFDSWRIGNQFASHVWSDNDRDIWSQIDEFNHTAKHSQAFGFIFDSTRVINELDNVSRVVLEFKRGLESGTSDPGERLPKFRDALKVAGIQNIIKEKQKQLDEWAKNNKS